MTEVIIRPTAVDAGDLVAAHLTQLIASRPHAVLGLATGSTPLTVYKALAREVRARQLAVADVRGFALDEYVGLPDGHPESYRAVITREVVEPLGLTPANIHVPDGDLAGIDTAGARYESALEQSGGVDVQILGIGTDGHIGFNEPGSSFASRTRVKTLTEQTRRDNARFFPSVDDVPVHCITQGLGTILRARHLILLAFGRGKAAAVAAAIEGPVSSSNPGSALQLHPHATVVIDEEAASELAHAEYYRYAWTNKPEWQGI